MPSVSELSVPMRALLAGAQSKQPEWLRLLGRLVEAESPSDDKGAVNRCVALAASHARALGGRVKLYRQRAFGDVLEARFGPRAKPGGLKPVLLVGHLDTVWPLGTLKTMPEPAGAGNSRMVTSAPEWRPTPSKAMGSAIVCSRWARLANHPSQYVLNACTDSAQRTHL